MKVGDIVKAFRKTGTYIGEITDIRPDVYVVRVLAVLKHPMQGNLHHPREVDVPFFHERKAHSYREQINVPANMVRSYEGEVPDYCMSLEQAVQKLHSELASKQEDPYSIRSLEALHVLLPEYELMYSMDLSALKKS